MVRGSATQFKFDSIPTGSRLLSPNMISGVHVHIKPSSLASKPTIQNNTHPAMQVQLAVKRVLMFVDVLSDVLHLSRDNVEVNNW